MTGKNVLKQAEETLKGFDGIDPANIQTELAGWKKKAEDAEKEFNAKIAERDFDDALKTALENVNFSSPAAKRSVTADIKSAGLKLKDGKILGLNDLLEQMKQDEPDTFVDESQQQAQQNQARFTTHVGQQQTPGNMTKKISKQSKTRPKGRLQLLRISSYSSDFLHRLYTRV